MLSAVENAEMEGLVALEQNYQVLADGDPLTEGTRSIHAEYPQLLRRLELTDRSQDGEFIGEQIEEYRRVTSGD